MKQLKIVQKDRRFGRGIAISLSRKVIKKSSMVYHVESETTNNKFYSVVFKDGPTSCNCPFFQNRSIICKHMYSVMYSIENHTVIDEIKQKEEDEYSY